VRPARPTPRCNRGRSQHSVACPTPGLGRVSWRTRLRARGRSAPRPASIGLARHAAAAQPSPEGIRHGELGPLPGPEVDRRGGRRAPRAAGRGAEPLGGVVRQGDRRAELRRQPGSRRVNSAGRCGPGPPGEAETRGTGSGWPEASCSESDIRHGRRAHTRETPRPSYREFGPATIWHVHTLRAVLRRSQGWEDGPGAWSDPPHGGRVGSRVAVPRRDVSVRRYGVRFRAAGGGVPKPLGCCVLRREHRGLRAPGRATSRTAPPRVRRTDAAAPIR
jgi:hypothetical protein